MIRKIEPNKHSHYANFDEKYNKECTTINNLLNILLLEDKSIKQNKVIDAMRYSLLDGGKRIRSIYLVNLCRVFEGNKKAAYLAACALECVHAYSLIHDDLPCMDNDDYRRGKLSNHKVYGEDFAVLAGDGLLTKAFEILSSNEMIDLIGYEKSLKLVSVLSRSAGEFGMLGGQSIDVEFEDQTLETSDFEKMVLLKTGALFAASSEMACIIADVDMKTSSALYHMSYSLGKAFQISDDILDMSGSDIDLNKNTYISNYGLEESKKILSDIYDNCKSTIALYCNDDKFLNDLIDKLKNRKS